MNAKNGTLAGVIALACTGLLFFWACTTEQPPASGTEPEASAQPDPEPEPAEPPPPAEPEVDRAGALTKLQALAEDAPVAEAEELIDIVMGGDGTCAECVDAVMKAAKSHKVPRVREGAVRSLGRSKVKGGEICTFWSETFQVRKGRDSGASGAALAEITRAQDRCKSNFDDVVTEIESRFAAHKEYGALTGAHVLYVQRFMEGNKHISKAQRGRVIAAAKKLASESEEGRPIQEMAAEIAALSAE